MFHLLDSVDTYSDTTTTLMSHDCDREWVFHTTS